MKNIAAFGEILWDVLPDGLFIGGAPFNLAYRVNSLGDRGIIISRIGVDKLGKRAYESVKSSNMETLYIQWDEKHSTGKNKITFDTNTVPSHSIITDVAYDYIEPTEGLSELASSADCIVFGTLVQRSSVSRNTLKAFLQSAGTTLKLVDINLRQGFYTEETILYSLENADIVKINEDELHEIARYLDDKSLPLFEICERIVKRWSLSLLIVTLGQRGALIVSSENEILYVPGFSVPRVDTEGCGDAFTAGFLHTYLRDSSIEKCCYWSNILGGITASQKGATQPIFPHDIRKFQQEHHTMVIDPNFKQYIPETISTY